MKETYEARHNTREIHDYADEAESVFNRQKVDEVRDADDDEKNLPHEGNTDNEDQLNFEKCRIIYDIDPEITPELCLEETLEKLLKNPEFLALLHDMDPRITSELTSKEIVAQVVSIPKISMPRISVAKIWEKATCIAVVKIEPDLVFKLFSSGHILIIQCLNHSDVDQIMAEAKKPTEALKNKQDGKAKKNTSFQQASISTHAIPMRRTVVNILECLDYTFPFNALKASEEYLYRDGKIRRDTLLKTAWPASVILKATMRLETNQGYAENKKIAPFVRSDELNEDVRIDESNEDSEDNENSYNNGNNDDDIRDDESSIGAEKTSLEVKTYGSSPEQAYVKAERILKEEKLRLLIRSVLSEKSYSERQIYYMHHEKEMSFRIIADAVGSNYRTLHHRFVKLKDSMTFSIFKTISYSEELSKELGISEEEIDEKPSKSKLNSALALKILNTLTQKGRTKKSKVSDTAKATADLSEMFKLLENAKRRISSRIKRDLLKSKAIKMRFHIKHKIAEEFALRLLQMLRGIIKKELQSSFDNINASKMTEVIKAVEELEAITINEIASKKNSGEADDKSTSGTGVSKISVSNTTIEATISSEQQKCLKNLMKNLSDDIAKQLARIVRNALLPAISTKICGLKRSLHTGEVDVKKSLSNQLKIEIKLLVAFLDIIDAINLREAQELLEKNSSNTGSSLDCARDNYEDAAHNDRVQENIYSDLFVLPRSEISNALKQCLTNFEPAAKELVEAELQNYAAHILMQKFYRCLESKDDKFWEELKKKTEENFLQERLKIKLAKSKSRISEL